MRSTSLTIVFPFTFDNPAYVNVTVEGTELAGIAVGSPVAVTLASDLSQSSSDGDSVITSRVIAADVLRFRACAPPFDQPITLTVTELLP